MSENLPSPWLLQASIYNVRIGGGTVITRIADRVDIVNHGISELRRELKFSNLIVGIDILNNGDWLLLYVKKRCLIIRYNHIRFFRHFKWNIPDSLLEFLNDISITFVGPRNITTKDLPYYPSHRAFSKHKSNVEDVYYFAAKILKKPNLVSSKLEELMVETGLDIINRPSGTLRPNWQSSSVLSEDEVEFALYEVVSCYKIATKLTDYVIGGKSQSMIYSYIFIDRLS